MLMGMYHTILLAINPDDLNVKQLVAKAGVIAEQNNADLHLAYVEPGVGNVSFLDIDLQLDEAHNEQELKRMAQLSDLAKHSPRPVAAIHLADGDVAKHLIALGKAIKADLVVTGNYKPGMHWLGDIRYELAQHLKCDVLICQQKTL
ncbi:universal stress protein [Photobacterium sp. SP02]|uniref:universal stress protein n=1 Tax=Photobacterium sp. SP02 TaxID=3032280 RepID=UPI003144FC61